MNSSFELGRIAGIRIGVNWSWIVIFGVITWSLAFTVFPSENPGRSDPVYVGMAVAAALLFFVSLLLHELGHAFQARREGMEIEGVTLWLLGGVARFRGMFPSAGAEFRIAIAGPLVSLALGAGFTAMAWLLSLPQVVDGVVFWLGYTNLFLLVFNLLPALPLDGGRVLRSLLWRLRGDFVWATRVAGGIGRGFGLLLMAGGVALAVWADPFGGIWLAFIGWFLLGAAGAETSSPIAHPALGGLHVRDLMVRDPVTTPPNVTLRTFIEQTVPRGHYATYPVVENGTVLGLLLWTDIVDVPRADWDTLTVRDCMVAAEKVPVLSADDELAIALEDLLESEFRRGVVIDDGRFVGLLSTTDLARVLETPR